MTIKAQHTTGQHVVAGEHTHLRPVRVMGTRPPLICLLPGVPGARDLAEFLPKDQPVYEIYEPNMDGASVFPTVEKLAESFLPDLRKIQPHGPYQLCGYSTFGLVAYEMARLLLAEGEDVSFLALFDIWHPRFRDGFTPREMARYRLMRVTDRSMKYLQFLIHGRFRDFADRLREFVVGKSRSISWRAVRFLYLMRNRPVPKAMQVVESIVSHKAYTPPVYPRRIILVRAKDLFEKMHDEAVGWHVCAIGGVDVHFIHGDHKDMIRQPYVRELAGRIAPYLAEPPRLDPA